MGGVLLQRAAFGLSGEAIQYVLRPYLGADEARRIGAEHAI